MARLLLLGAAVVTLVSVGYAVSRKDAEPAADKQIAAAGDTKAPDTESIIRSLQERVGANPKDAEGWQQLGWVYFETGKYPDAARAYRRATELAPDNATFWSSLGEALAMADEQNPMPDEAGKAFDKALALDPKDPRARYFVAVRKDLAGDHKGALDDWFALLKDTPAGAPWEQDLRRTIEQVGKINNVSVADRLAAIAPAAADPHDALVGGVATAAIPGPSREQMQAAASLPKGQQDAMISGMVESLEGKLRANPANVEGWVMLMRSRMTLGESSKASAALRSAIAANPSKESYLRQQASLIAVPGA
tara:strand:- start:111506 stop:112429 length:924 start_codon:yes stop_codon:yes gene_type:complete